MKQKIKSIAKELRDELGRSPDIRVQQLIDLDEDLDAKMQSFGKGIGDDQQAQWNELCDQINLLRKYAQMSKMRLLCGDPSLPDRLDALHDELEKQEKVEQAEIEVGRDMHRASGLTDVFKALLMWKDTPEEKLNEEE